MKRRSTFRRRKNGPCNENVFAYRRTHENHAHYAWLHHPERKRSEVELETMRLAAQRRSHGFAAAFLATVASRKAAKPRTKKAAA